MRLPNEEKITAPVKAVGVQSASATVRGQTAPAQIWLLLSPAQQKQIFQRLVLICRQLLNGHDRVASEVNDEPS